MRVLAWRGSGSHYLVTNSTDESDLDPPSTLVDMELRVGYKMSAQQALKQGYWEEPPDISDEHMAEIRQAVANTIESPEEFYAARKAADEKVFTREKFEVFDKDGRKKLGTVYFGGELPIEITSRDLDLLEVVTPTMVSPVEVKDDEGGTIYAVVGDILFPEAVQQLLKNEGYALKNVT